MGHSILAVLLGMWFVFEIWLTLVHSFKHEERETFSKWVMFSTLNVSLFGGFIFEGPREAFLESFSLVRYAGLIVIFAGLILRVAAVRQLGASFNVDPQVLPGQKLVRVGLYRYLRHPGYLADLVAFAGLAIVFWNPLSSLLVLLLPTIGILYRIRVEEKILKDAFGPAYKAYRQETSALVPWIY